MIDRTRPAGKPQPKVQVQQPAAKADRPPAAKFYEAKPGFANYYFNKQERDRLLAGFQKHGDFARLDRRLDIEGDVRAAKGPQADGESQLIAR